MANKAANSWIESFDVEEDEAITTHDVLKLRLKRKAARGEKTYAAPLASLITLFQTKIKEIVGDRQGKEAADSWKEQRELLHGCIGERFDKNDAEIRIRRQQKDTSEVWKVWSRAVEQGWLAYLDEGIFFDREANGRGEMKLATTDPTKPNTKPKKGDGGRGGVNDVAFKAIRQARRCEQLVARIQMLKDERKDEQKRHTYYTLNIEGIRQLRKHQGAHDWEQDGIEKLKQTNQAAEDIAVIPSIKRFAGKYHEEARKQKELAERESERCNKKRYEAKGEGGWALCKDMGSNNANPLIAVTRPKRGQQGQPKGSVATSPKEIDAIIRETYGKVYKGNVVGHEKLV